MVIEWNEEKNQKIKTERGICFEDIIIGIQEGGLVADTRHPNQVKYKGQRLYYVRILDYIYVVPYIQSGQKIFLKTVYASRAATKKYIKK